MGNKIMGKFRRSGLEEFHIDQIEYLQDKWDLISVNGAIDIDKFARSYNMTILEAKKLVDSMDLDKTGRVDQEKFNTSAANFCKSTSDFVAKLLFEMYDFDSDEFIGLDDLIVFVGSFMRGLAYYGEQPVPSSNEIKQMAQSLMIKYDCKDKDGALSLEEFTQMLKKDHDILKLLFEYGFLSKADLTIEETDYNDIDSDLEVEMDRRHVQRDERIERIKNGIEHNVISGHDHEYGLEDLEVETPCLWLPKVKDQTPSDYVEQPDQSNPPNAYLDLEYVYGYRCHDTRNNLRYGDQGQVVYHTAGVGIVMDARNMIQTHYLEHSDDITCLDIFGHMVLTGQHGLTPMLMIWDLDHLDLLCIWKDQLKNGIANCSFSNNGKMVVAVAMDDDHSVVIYDIDKGMAFRKDPKDTDFGLVATGKLTQKEVFDIKFQPGDKSIIVACMKEINIITWNEGVISSQKCIWLDQIPQAVLTIGFIEGFCVTGMFSGELFVWKRHIFERNVIAHHDPVLAMWTRTNGRGIISGAKRGLIIVWDQTLTKLFEINSRAIGLPLYPTKAAITSLCESPDGKILFGTRGSMIIEVQPFKAGQQISAKVLMQGHFQGELWGLAVHPSNSTFYTVGEDEMLAQWDTKSKSLIKSIDTTHSSKTCSVSSNAKHLAVGATNGKVTIYDPNSLEVQAVISEFIDPDKDILSLVKFSPNSEILAVAYSLPYNLIVFYSEETNWQRVGQIKDLPATVSCLDFSIEGMYIQANFINNDIFFYDVSKAAVINSGETMLKDEKWATWTSILGWSVQGIWPKCSSGTDINSCDRSNDGTILVTGDDFGKVKLFKYPSPIECSGSGKYTGHSSYVQNVRFTYDNKYVISVGGDELSIFQWRYQNNPNDLDIDHTAIDAALVEVSEEDPTEINPTEVDQSEVDTIEEQKIQSVKGQKSSEIQKQDSKNDEGDSKISSKPFYGEMLHSIPSWYKPNAKRDNVLPIGNLSIYHVMGFRYFYILDECRDMCAWTDRGTVAFATAALGVEMDPITQNQTFFNKHQDDIVSFALHPSKKFCATGQMASVGKAKCIDIYVWDIEKKEVVAHFNKFHLKAVVFLKFSPDGTQLLSVGQDNDNSLAIHDWQANRLISSSNVDKAKVNCVAWASETEFCTVGNKHIKFWTLSGRNLLGKMGTQGGKFESQFSVSYAFKNRVCVSGGGEGNLFLWKARVADKAIPAHKGKVQSLKMDEVKNLLYSAGMDGKVCAWGYEGGNLVKKLEVIDLSKVTQFNAGITAMDIDPKTGAFLLGTCSAEIFSYEPVSNKSTLILQGHFGKELWAACASPSSHKFVSAGADKTVRIWDIDTKKMLIASKPFDNDIRGVDWAANSKFIVCADLLGFIFLLDPNTLEVKDKGVTHFTKMPKAQSTKWIEDIKVSPDCKTCAFGAHGGVSPVEMWEIHFPKFGKSQVINAGLTSALLHIDWSTDSSIALVNSEAYEMKFVDMHAGKNAISSTCKDVEFATWTCKLGFPVQGIFPSSNLADVHAVCRSQSKKYLATGENSSKVVLFQYPVVVEKQKRKEYFGHSSHVTRVRFTFDDDFLISTGGNDKSIIVWKTDFGQEPTIDHSQLQQEEGEEDIDVVVLKQETSAVDTKQIQDPQKKLQQEKIQQDKQAHGAQFMAVRPWLGAIKEPTPPFYEDKKSGFKPPHCKIALEYVYGYRSKDMRSNIYYLANDKILYNAAGLAIILDIQSNTQTFFDLHQDDITAIDMNPKDRRTCATGEVGAKPNLYVWDSETKEVICKFQGVLTKGIISLSFSPSGKKLVGGAIDVDHYIAVFDVSHAPGSVIWTDKGGHDTIIDLRWNTEDSWASVGVKHYILWTLHDKVIKQAKGAFGKACNKVSGIGINGNDIVCGAQDGTIQVWNANSLSKELQDHHTLSCDCIHVSSNNVLSGGRDGLIIIFDKTYKKITEINCKVLFPTSVLAAVRSIYVHPTKHLIVVGTLGSEIYEISYNTSTITAETVFKINSEAMKGHFCPNLQWTNEVWGLDVNQSDPNLFSTCSDDGTFRVWNAELRKSVSIGFCTKDLSGKKELKDQATGDLSDKCKARSIAVALNGTGFVVGMKDGTIRVFDGKLVQTKVFKRAKAQISEIKFSPDGTTMVYGSHDDTIYACKWPQLTSIGDAPMQKHSSYITHIDYSCDGANLHSTCGAYELLFWDLAKGKQLTGGATALRDEQWHTWTVSLGWPVQGIWPEHSNGTDVNAVDRSKTTIDGKSDPNHSYYLVATGDSFGKVRILRYPSIRNYSESIDGRGHSSHVTKVRWNHDDTKIFSTGGEDQCVIQWKVTKL